MANRMQTRKDSRNVEQKPIIEEISPPVPTLSSVTDDIDSLLSDCISHADSMFECIYGYKHAPKGDKTLALGEGAGLADTLIAVRSAARLLLDELEEIRQRV